MHDPGRVGGSEGVGDVGCDAQGRRERERGALVALGHIFALEPLHRDEGLPFVELSKCHDTDDSRVVEPRQDATFALEPRFFARIDSRERDDFERDGVAPDLIVRAINDADATSADLALDDEAPGKRL
jgi:hypothetical protein